MKIYNLSSINIYSLNVIFFTSVLILDAQQLLKTMNKQDISLFKQLVGDEIVVDMNALLFLALKDFFEIIVSHSYSYHQQEF